MRWALQGSVKPFNEISIYFLLYQFREMLFWLLFRISPKFSEAFCNNLRHHLLQLTCTCLRQWDKVLLIIVVTFWYFSENFAELLVVLNLLYLFVLAFYFYFCIYCLWFNIWNCIGNFKIEVYIYIICI